MIEKIARDWLKVVDYMRSQLHPETELRISLSDTEALCNAALASLTPEATGQTAEQDGWKLVPIHPTREMQLAGLQALDEGGLGDCHCDQLDVWRAMIAIAPTPPAKEDRQ